MPTPAARWRALHLVTRALGGDVRAAPADQWSAAVDLAIEHGLGGALAAALSSHATAMPAAAREQLDWNHKSTIARALRMQREARNMVRVLDDAGVEPLLMKGALLSLTGALPSLGVRVAADLDVVVRAAQWDAAVAAIEGAGYAPAPGPPFLHPHELPFLHPACVAPVELHASLGGVAIDAVLPVEDAWARAARVERDGIVFWALSSTDQIVHNVAHAQLQDLNHAVLGVPLRQLHTFVLLVRAHGDAVDWSEARRTFASADASEAYAMHLALVRELFGVPVPEPGRRAAMRAHVAVALAVSGPMSDVVRNTRHALGAEYLDSLYHHGGRPLPLAVARARHLWRTGRSLGRRGVVESVTHPLR